MLKSLNIKTLFLNGRNYVLCGLTFIAIGLSISKPLMVLGLMFMGGGWIIDGNYSKKLSLFIKNKPALMISSIYFITVFGLIHTSNYTYGFDDLRKKMALFFIPFILSGFKPLSKKEFLFLLKIYIGWVAFACCWSFCVYFGVTGEQIIDIRDYSRYNSHIRFGLEIVLAFFICLYLIKETPSKNGLWLAVFMLLFLTTLFWFSLITGIAVFICASIVVLVYFGVSSTNFKVKIGLFIIGLATLIFLFLFIKSAINDFYANENIIPIKEIKTTPYGEFYQIDEYTDNSKLKENGYFVEKNIAWHEFSEAWNKRSNIKFEDRDLKGNELKYTLIRFITSKGLRKDKDAIDGLSVSEIKAIEKGVPNQKYLTMNNISVRLHKIIWEYNAYRNGGDINGHSVFMRLEYLKAALNIFKTNFWIGVGTGDIQDSYNKYYASSGSILTKKYQRRGHNQYLTYFATLGVLGGVWFLIVFFYPLIKLKLYKSYLYLAFLTIICVSMLTEDTLEIKTGIYLFVFFNSLFLLRNKNEK